MTLKDIDNFIYELREVKVMIQDTLVNLAETDKALYGALFEIDRLKENLEEKYREGVAK